MDEQVPWEEGWAAWLKNTKPTTTEAKELAAFATVQVPCTLGSTTIVGPLVLWVYVLARSDKPPYLHVTSFGAKFHQPLVSSKRPCLATLRR